MFRRTRHSGFFAFAAATLMAGCGPEPQPMDVVEATIAQVQNAILAGETTCRMVVQAYLDRIEAYDKKGPEIRAMITVNPNALKEARALDKERRKQGSRSLLHPVNQSHGWRKICAVANLHHTVPPAGGSAGRGELRESGKF